MPATDGPAGHGGPTSGRVAVLGLGLMGGTLAGHLLDADFEVIGHDPDPDRRREHHARGGRAVGSVAEAVTGAVAGADVRLVVLSLPNSAIMLDVCREIVDCSPPGGAPLVIDTTTGDPDDSSPAAEMLTAAGGGYVDATVSGNAAQAAAKDIIFMVGGAERDVARATELLRLLGRRVYHVGGVASGSRAKLVVNHVLSINRTALAEGLTVAEKAGVDLGPMLAILRDSAAYSKAMDLWGDRMVAADHHPPNSRVRQSLKDSRLINDHAESIGASRALVNVVRSALTEAADGGLGDADNSAIMEVMRRRAGIGRLTSVEDQRMPPAEG